MASHLVELADAIKTHVTGGAPYVIDPIVVERRWLPYLERTSIGTTTKLVVVPNASTQRQLTRSQTGYSLVVDVFVQKAVNWESTEPDATCELAEQVTARLLLLKDVIVTGQQMIGRVGVTFEPLVVGEHMIEYRLWTSRITTTWFMGV